MKSLGDLPRYLTVGVCVQIFELGEMKLMFSQCKYEVAIFGRSPWCAVFTPEDLKLLDFREDLDDFYKDAYGSDLNWQQACPIAQDLFEYIMLVPILT